jgi:hypothetical protein
VSHSFGYILQEWDCWIIWQIYVYIFKKLLYFLLEFVFAPAVYKGSFFPTFLPTPVGGGVFDDGYSNRGEVIPQN